jgi:hypothetical protein
MTGASVGGAIGGGGGAIDGRGLGIGFGGGVSIAGAGASAGVGGSAAGVSATARGASGGSSRVEHPSPRTSHAATHATSDIAAPVSRTVDFLTVRLGTSGGMIDVRRRLRCSFCHVRDAADRAGRSSTTNGT